MNNRDKTGYLTEPIKLFYLSDKKEWPCPYHYHDFDKITLFFQGNVIYEIEGQSYHLKPYDIVIVRAGQMHRPLIAGTTVYERIIAYISPQYIESYQKRHCDLSVIFHKNASPVLRQPQAVSNIYGVSCRLRRLCSTASSPMNTVLQEAVFLELLICLAEAIQNQHIGYVTTGEENKKIRRLLDYINDHIAADLSVPALAQEVYVSPDYLMHVFKKETGFSLGQYITAKRLQKARLLLEQGLPLTTVCYDSGFKNYSTFYRAWKKCYGASPRKGALTDAAAPTAVRTE